MKPIFTSLAPNTEWDDVWLALRLMVQPWRWSRGGTIEQLERIFREWLPVKHTFAFVSGRTCLYAILSTLELKLDDEVLLQAYTCVAVPDPVLWAGAKPVYVDCEEDTFNMSPGDLERKITSRSRVLVIQHTFGLPANLDALLAIAKKHDLFVIEDCAHALGATYHGQRVGTFGDAAFYSFGRDKVISSVFGGMAVTNDDTIARGLKDLQNSWKYPSKRWIFQQLLHPIITTKAKFFWRVFELGKLILAIAKVSHFTSKAVYGVEKKGGKPRFVEHRMPNALALLALHQFQKLEQFNQHRRKIAALYDARLAPSPQSSPTRGEEGIKIPSPSMGEGQGEGVKHTYLRYTIRIPQATRLLKEAKKKAIYLGDWYRTPIAPEGVDYAAIRYQPGSCPVAERLARESINLPTDIHVSEKDAARIVECIKKILV